MKIRIHLNPDLVRELEDLKAKANKKVLPPHEVSLSSVTMAAIKMALTAELHDEILEDAVKHIRCKD